MKDLVVQQLQFQRKLFQCEFDFCLSEGEWLGVTGRSGAGKTTLLELMAGFEQAGSGEIFLNQVNLTNLDAKARRTAYLFQSGSLFPNLTISQNLELALLDPKFKKSMRLQLIDEFLDAVSLSGMHNRFPGQLSGGEQARATLARALLKPSKLLLLDEPFSSLDSELRREMHVLVKKLQAKHGFMVICISHQMEDNLLFADQLMILHEGKIEELAPPSQLCKQPRSLSTARLLGYGIILQGDTGKYFVRFDQLTSSELKAEKFLSREHIPVPNYKIVATPRGAAVLCLDTGIVYPIEQSEAFKGKFYYDKSLVTIF